MTRAVVVPCAGGPGPLPAFAGAGAEGAVLAATFGIVSGMGGSPVTLVEVAGRAAELGRRNFGYTTQGWRRTRTWRRYGRR